MIDTPEDIAEYLAEWLGLTVDSLCDYRNTKALGHRDGCYCREKWVTAFAARMRESVKRELQVRLGNALTRALTEGGPTVKRVGTPEAGGVLMSYGPDIEAINRAIAEELGGPEKENVEEAAVPSPMPPGECTGFNRSEEALEEVASQPIFDEKDGQIRFEDRTPNQIDLGRNQ